MENNPTLMPAMPDLDSVRNEFNRIQSSFEPFTREIDANRTIRRASSNVAALREQKKIAEHETLIQVRVIDENIERDKPTYIAYLKQSARYAIFVRKDGVPDPTIPRLESWFKTMMCYDNPPWELDYIKVIDGALCHGLDFVEVVYDATKPGHVAVNHIGIDRLVYDLDFDDIEQSPQVARGYRMSVIELTRFKEQGLFKAAEADALIHHIKQTSGGQSRATATPESNVFKIYVKHGGLVYFTYYAPVTQAFLTDLQPFYNGITRLVEEVQLTPDPQTFSMVPQTIQKPVTQQEQVYPFVTLRKKVTEDASLRQIKGHAHDTYYLQEAATSMTSALVNGTQQATTTMWAPDSDAGLEGTSTKQTALVIQQNAVWNRAMRAFTPPYPDPMLINTLQHLETRNAVATNNQAFAVQNRKDARKTAQELKMAESATSQVNSVQVLHLSICVRSIAQRAFNIMQSEVLIGNLVLNQLDRGLFETEYIITSAGDIDYVERMELIQSMQQDLPALMGTPVGPLLLEDYIRYRYPAFADRYTAALKQPSQDEALISGLSQLVQELAVDDAGQLNPDAAPHAQQLQQLSQLVAQRLAQPMGGVAAQPANSAPPQPPQGAA